MTHEFKEVLRHASEAGAKSSFPTDGYVRLKQILGPHGPLPISRSGFWAGVKAGKYPKPRKISARVTVWRAEDIQLLLQKIEQGNS